MAECITSILHYMKLFFGCLLAACSIVCLFACPISTNEPEDSSDIQDAICLLQSIGTVSSPTAGIAVHETKSTAFAQLSSEDSLRQRVSAKRPFSAGWFGSFSEDESSYTEEGLDAKHSDPVYDVMYGRDPHVTSEAAGVLDYESLHESRSGGPTAAWQTYQSERNNIVGNNGDLENDWRYTPYGWVQDYNPTSKTESPRILTATRDADWFDNFVHQVDGFGRQKTPGVEDGRRYIADGWQERSVNTSLTCANPGCVARGTLQLYDASKEVAKLCRISIMVHPTDFDDDHSQENVEYWKIEDYIASRACNPKARGCNATATKPLYPCLSEFDIDRIVNKTSGSVVLEGKISQMVDECPHKGSLLSAVGMGTCLIRNKTDLTTTTTTADFHYAPLHAQTILNCTTPGCIAEATLSINPSIALNGGKCTMNVSVTMTDYDNSSEEISYIAIEGKNIVTPDDKDAQPGKNPCNEAYSGTSVSPADRVFQSVKDYDVTQSLLNTTPHGTLKITGKNSRLVDECAYDGNLLYAIVKVTCTPPAHFSASPPPYSSVFETSQDSSGGR